MKYIVQVSETLVKRVEVEADNYEEARYQVENDYYNNNIELTADDYVDGSVQFEVVWGEQVVCKQSRTTNNS